MALYKNLISYIKCQLAPPIGLDPFSPVVKEVIVIFSRLVLENRSFNITKYFSHIIKVFEDFKLVQQIREEIERVKPCIVLATL